MKTSTRVLATASAAAMMLSLAACGNNNNTDPSNAGSDGDVQHYTVGICQYVQHAALDQATEAYTQHAGMLGEAIRGLIQGGVLHILADADGIVLYVAVAAGVGRISIVVIAAGCEGQHHGRCRSSCKNACGVFIFSSSKQVLQALSLCVVKVYYRSIVSKSQAVPTKKFMLRGSGAAHKKSP